MSRSILHCDMNNFYASVECMLDPVLKKYPVAVCGSVEERHGIVLAKNYAAKAFGIKTGDAVWQAKQKCRNLVVVPPHFEEYIKYSKLARSVYSRYTDQVEPYGMDECWLDISGTDYTFGSPEKVANDIRETIKFELGLTISVGVSFNKVFAKLGSDYKKPDATTVFSRAQMEELVWPLPVGSMLYVGGRFERQLRELGIRTIGDLARSDKSFLRQKFGIRGESAWHCANGDEHEPVRPYHEHRESKSIGNSITFRRDLLGKRDIQLGFTALAESVSERMRRHGVHCRTVQIQIRDPAFHTISRQVTLERSVSLSRELTATAMALAEHCWDFSKPVRLLALTAEQLIPIEQDAEQLTLFPDAAAPAREKQGRLEDTLSSIRGKYGKCSIQLGSFLGNDLGLGGSGNKLENDETD